MFSLPWTLRTLWTLHYVIHTTSLMPSNTEIKKDERDGEITHVTISNNLRGLQNIRRRVTKKKATEEHDGSPDSPSNVLSTVMDNVSMNTDLLNNSPSRSSSVSSSANTSQNQSIDDARNQDLPPNGPSVTILATIAGVAGMTLVCIVISVYMCHRHYSSGSKYKKESAHTSNDTPSSRRRDEEVNARKVKPPMSVVNIDQNDNRSIDDTTLGLFTAGRNPGPPVRNIVTSNMTYVSGLDTVDVLKELKSPVKKHKQHSVASASAETDGSSYNLSSTNSKSLTVPTLLERDKVGLGLHMDCEDTLGPASVPSVAPPNENNANGVAVTGRPSEDKRRVLFEQPKKAEVNQGNPVFNSARGSHLRKKEEFGEEMGQANNVPFVNNPKSPQAMMNGATFNNKQEYELELGQGNNVPLVNSSKSPQAMMNSVTFNEKQEFGVEMGQASNPPHNVKSPQTMMGSGTFDTRSPPVSSETENKKSLKAISTAREKYEAMTAPVNSFGKKYNPWNSANPQSDRIKASSNSTNLGPWSFEATEMTDELFQPPTTTSNSQYPTTTNSNSPHKSKNETEPSFHSPSTIIDLNTAKEEEEEVPQSSQSSTGEDSSLSTGEEQPWLLDAVEATIGPRTLSADMDSLGDRSKRSSSNISSHSKSSSGIRSNKNSVGSKKSGSSVGSRRSNGSRTSSTHASITNELQRLEAQLASLSKSFSEESNGGSVGTRSSSVPKHVVRPSPNRNRIPTSIPSQKPSSSPGQDRHGTPRTRSSPNPSPLRYRDADGKIKSGRTSPSSRHSRDSRGSRRSNRSNVSQISKESRSVAKDLMRLEAQLAALNKTKQTESGSKSVNSSSISKSTEISRASYISQRRVKIVVPPGKIGIILMNRTDKKGTVVAEVRNTSPLLGKIFEGDKVVQIDGIDVSRTSVSEITALMASKSDRNRVLSVVTSHIPEASSKTSDLLPKS